MQNDATKKTKWGRKFWLVASLLILITTLLFFAIKSQNEIRTITVAGNPITVEVARTDAQRTHGLCCRDFLGPHDGMLFIYDQPGDYRLWMKDTRIPLDMYWINSDWRIVHIEHSVQPGSYPQRFGASQPSQYLLETNAGYAKANNISVGDEVSF